LHFSDIARDLATAPLRFVDRGAELTDGVEGRFTGRERPERARVAAGTLVPAVGIELIGIGTGRNLPFYDPARLDSLEGPDPAGQMNAKRCAVPGKPGSRCRS
jgi:hypothetical protein